MNPEWDSEQWREARDAQFRAWLGDESAVECIVMISSIVEAWDDLIDGDAVEPERINRTFLFALVGMHRNRFWRQFGDQLLPIMMSCINAWMDSNEWQKGDRKQRMMAFYLRNMGIELIQAAAFCLGGFERMREISLDVRKFFMHESYEDWEHAL